MKRGLSENKLNKNKSTTNKLNLIQKEKPKSLVKNKSNQNNENKNEIKKPLYNIDLFTGIKEDSEKDKNTNKNSIYLNFYNKHTKNQVLQKESKISKKFFDNNVEYIKEKQEKYKLKKEEEEKIKKQKEREDTNEYRKEQRIKLYKMEDVYKREILKRNNKKLFSKSKEKIANIAKNKNDIKNKKGEKIDEENIKRLEDGNEIKITKTEYDKKLDFFIKQSRLCLNELEKLPIANKTMKVYERESQLNKYIKVLQDNIFKYQNHIGITIID